MTYQSPDDQQPQYQQPQYQQPPPYQQPSPYQQPYEQYPSAPPPGYGGYPQPPRSNGMAIAALVCGIVGLIVLSVVLGPIALVLGWIGLGRANRGATGKGMAIAGLVLGAIDLVLGIVAIAYFTGHPFVV